MLVSEFRSLVPDAPPLPNLPDNYLIEQYIADLLHHAAQVGVEYYKQKNPDGSDKVNPFSFSYDKGVVEGQMKIPVKIAVEVEA